MILSKYRKPAKEAAKDKKLEEIEKAKRIAKEKQRLMGRKVPEREQEPHERELMRIATKGVV